VASKHRIVTCASAYCASELGVVGFTRALAAESAGEVGCQVLMPAFYQMVWALLFLLWATVVQRVVAVFPL
jgi:NAD(P)-dependent dehydrogenase (short-subunit alcohol dehydrogenase family)